MIQKIIDYIKQTLKQSLCSQDIAELQHRTKVYKEWYEGLSEQYQDLESLYNQTISDNQALMHRLNNYHEQRFEIAKNQFKPINQQYKGKWLRSYLNDFSKDNIYQDKYLSFLKQLGMKESYKDIDDVVYRVVMLVQDYVNNTLPVDYQTDQELFGKADYWVTPQEAFDYYVTQETAGDCDNNSNFLYGCIVTALNYFGYDWEGRLLRVNMTLPIGHAVLAWLKNNGTWACIESTYHEDRFGRTWVDNKDIFKSVYIQLWHIFDERKEYRLIN
jgi:hypothetical protein